jgi:hypothetical protein
MNVYAKIISEANVEFDENGVSVPVYLNLEDAPTLPDEEMRKIIGEFVEVSAQFIVLVTEEEYKANVGEESPYQKTGTCDGCTNCSCDDDTSDCSGGCCGK